MTETTKEYIARLEEKFRPVRCPNCWITYGHVDGEYLKLGSLKIKKVEAICDMPLCGGEIRWPDPSGADT